MIKGKHTISQSLFQMCENYSLDTISIYGIIDTMTTKAMTIRLPEELKRRLENAVDHKNSQNAIVVKALVEFFIKNKS